MAYTDQESEEEDKSEDSEETEAKPKKVKKEKKRSEPDLREGAWWRAKALGKEPHAILDNVVTQIRDDQKGRYEAYKEYERLFGSSVGSNEDDSWRVISSDELIQNELQNTIETLWAQIFKDPVIAGISTSEADWDEWDKARSYSRWLEGAFDEEAVYDDAFPRAGLHMLTHGTGFIRIGWEETEDDGVAKIKCWHVNPKYVLVDRLEGKHGKPRNIHFKDHVDRYQLWDTYCQDDDGFYGKVEDRRTGINKAISNDDLELGTSSVARCDMITVWESYHLPSGPKAKDGRHTIWIKGCTLVDEEFCWDRFPVVVMRFGGRMEGFYGESAVRRLAPTQKLLDKLNLKLDESQDVMGVPRVIVGNGGSGLKTQHLDDITGSILVLDGSVDNIKEWNAQCATSELYQDRDNAPGKMRALLGISDFEASSQLPAGLRDVGAPFMEHYVEQGTARHALNHAQYENAVKDLAYLHMLMAEELQEKGYDVVVKGPADSTSKTSIEELSFKDVHIERKRLKLRIQPMSQLPKTFSGKVEAFEKMQQAMLPIDPKTALRMLEVPDLAGAQDMLVSDEEIIMKNLSYMCKTGEYLAPLPYDNLDLIVQLTTRYINRYRVRAGKDMSKVSLLAQYIDDAMALKNGVGGPDPNAPPSVTAPMGMAGGMPPMGPPPGPQGFPPPGMAGPPGGPMPMAAPPSVGGAPMPPQGPQLGMSAPQQLQIGPPGPPM